MGNRYDSLQRTCYFEELVEEKTHMSYKRYLPGQQGYAFSKISRDTSSYRLCDIYAPRPLSLPPVSSSVEYLILTKFSNRCCFLLCLCSVSLLYFSGVLNSFEFNRTSTKAF